MQGSTADRLTSFQLHRMRALLWGRVLDAKLHALHRAIKANFDPNQPRVPAGNPDGGQWASVGGSGGAGSESDVSGDASSDVLAGGANDDLPEDPSKIPKERPRTSRARTRFYKEAAKWLAKAALKEVLGKKIAAFLTLLDEVGWLEPAIDSIRTFADPPKSLEELQRDVSTSAPGYDVHHIVEQTAAERDGFPQSMIDAPENLVRIPRLKHWMITGWYMVKNPKYRGASPRAYLEGKSWSERERVGRKALIEFGVLKP